ncbi:MAG TPA: hypothetical protein VGZ47_20465, partial [Gemmataceae bacterium]|nr:hypothetical protein [Gemmataceae bacterium]
MRWAKTSFFLAAAAILITCAAEGQAQFPPIRPTLRNPLGVGLFATNPMWNARGVGQLPWQGIACLDVSDDGKLI